MAGVVRPLPCEGQESFHSHLNMYSLHGGLSAAFDIETSVLRHRCDDCIGTDAAPSPMRGAIVYAGPRAAAASRRGGSSRLGGPRHGGGSLPRDSTFAGAAGGGSSQRTVCFPLRLDCPVHVPRERRRDCSRRVRGYLAAGARRRRRLCPVLDLCCSGEGKPLSHEAMRMSCARGPVHTETLCLSQPIL